MSPQIHNFFWYMTLFIEWIEDIHMKIDSFQTKVTMNDEKHRSSSFVF